MDLAQIEKVIEDHIDIITVDAKGLAESLDRAAKFLVVWSVLSNYLKDLEIEIGKHETVVDALLAQALRESEGKNITEKKANAAENAIYSTARTIASKLEAQRYWIKTHMKIFENSHLFFRQCSRE